MLHKCVHNQRELSPYVTRPKLIRIVPQLLYRVGYIETVRGPSICVVDRRGLLKVVPKHGAGDKGSGYCIDGFAIDRYSDLLS